MLYLFVVLYLIFDAHIYTYVYQIYIQVIFTDLLPQFQIENNLLTDTLRNSGVLAQTVELQHKYI